MKDYFGLRGYKGVSEELTKKDALDIATIPL